MNSALLPNKGKNVAVASGSLTKIFRIFLILTVATFCAGTGSAEDRGSFFLFDGISVKSGKVTVRFSPSETISFEIEAYHAYDNQGGSAGATEKITIRNVVVKSIEARDDGTIDLIEATIRRHQTGGGQIEELRIVNPKLTVSGEMLRSIVRLITGDPAERAGDGGTEQWSPAWTIGEIRVEGAEVTIRGFGDAAPIIRAEFDLHDSDLRFGGEPLRQEEEIQRELRLRNVTIAAVFERQEPFFRARQIDLQFTTDGLERRKEIDQVLLEGASMEFGREFRSILSAKEENVDPSSTASKGGRPERPWLIRKLEIEEGQAILADLGDPNPDIRFDATTTIENIYLTGDPSYGDESLRTVELANLTIHSPLDPFVPVANLHSVFIRFTVAGLLRKNISEVVVLSPIIFIGPDLFWYVNELKKGVEDISTGGAKKGDKNEEPGEWTIDAFKVATGKLVVTSGGEARLTLPIGFSSRAGKIRFANLSELQLKMNFLVPRSDYHFPSYQLEFEDFGGNLEFGLPPDSGANNLVQTLRAVGMKWRQFDAANIWLSVTYDQDGIYGIFGGDAYRGYITGAFTVYLQATFPWTGWVSATDLSLEEITRIMTPQSLTISGPGSAVVEVNGRTRLIERLKGTIVASEPGEFRIGKLDELIQKIPPNWTTLKQTTTRISLETLRDFQYETCNGEFWYAGDSGEIELGLAGPTGSRNFHVELHPKK